MPLHRDIFWVGKQWSVTGHGLQAIDQKLKGKFDIEASRVWDDDLSDALRDEKWFNSGDFDKGLAEARKRYPQPGRNAAPKAALALVAPAPDNLTPAKDPPKASASAQAKASPASAPAKFAMRIEGCRAKFLPAWRIRVRWQR